MILTGAGSGDTIIQAAISSADATSRVLLITKGYVAISGVTIRFGKAQVGGGILNRHESVLTLTSSAVSENEARDGGGGIWNEGTLTLTNSTISENYAEHIDRTTGGGVLNTSILTLTNSAVGSNRGDQGGSINNQFGTVTMINSTVSKNYAEVGGGFINWGKLTLTNSTISGNRASGLVFGDGGGGIYNDRNSIITLNTIIAANTVPNGPDCRGTSPLISLGYNLIGDSSGCIFTPASGDVVNVDAMLGLLQDNAGPTFTHALLPSSQAIDAGDDDACPVTDQRGVIRPQGAGCDIGAFEVEAAIPGDVNGDRVVNTRDLRIVQPTLVGLYLLPIPGPM